MGEPQTVLIEAGVTSGLPTHVLVRSAHLSDVSCNRNQEMLAAHADQVVTPQPTSAAGIRAKPGGTLASLAAAPPLRRAAH